MDGKGNITTTAPETMTFNCKNMNINVAQNMNTSVGMNISENAGMNKATTVGAIHNMFVGGDNMMNVMGKMDTLVKGDYISHTEKERKEVATKGHDVQSTDANVNVKTSKELNKHSGEQTKAN